MSGFELNHFSTISPVKNSKFFLEPILQKLNLKFIFYIESYAIMEEQNFKPLFLGSIPMWLGSFLLTLLTAKLGPISAPADMVFPRISIL